jgi:hypothetical protein
MLTPRNRDTSKPKLYREFTNAFYGGSIREQGTVSQIARARIVEIGANASEVCGHDPILKFFFDLWMHKRGSRIMPSRADFRPTDMRTHIGLIVVAEALPDYADFRFKLIGTEVARYFLADGTGKTIREAYAPLDEHFGECVLKNFRGAAARRMPLHTRLDGIRWSNGFVFDMKAVYLPLSEDGSTASSVLTAFSYAFGKRPTDGGEPKLHAV